MHDIYIYRRSDSRLAQVHKRKHSKLKLIMFINMVEKYIGCDGVHGFFFHAMIDEWSVKWAGTI